MIFKAFLTGSRAYGTPRPDSDVDIVMRMPQETVDILLSAIPAEKVRKYPANDSVSLWFDNLNLICLTTDKAFETWIEGTACLMVRKPVTRDEAIEEFNKRGIEKCFASQDPSLPKEVVPQELTADDNNDVPF